MNGSHTTYKSKTPPPLPFVKRKKEKNKSNKSPAMRVGNWVEVKRKKEKIKNSQG